MRKRIIPLIPLFMLLLPMLATAQQAVLLGGRTVIPTQNISRSRGSLAKLTGKATNGKRNALIQFKAIPSPATIERLNAAGIELDGALGGNAYWALVPEKTSSLQQLIAHSNTAIGLTSMMDIRPEWKMTEDVERGRVPQWAQLGNNAARIMLMYAANANRADVKTALQQKGMTNLHIMEDFHMAWGNIPTEQLKEIATIPFVLSIQFADPESETGNWRGSVISRAAYLAKPAALKGRGLTGKSVRIGIWDTNVESHADFEERVHRMEFEVVQEHGTHVAGTVLGAGIIDPRGEGMAPEATAYSWNFNIQRNGLSAAEEMLYSKRQFGISITQNSYGPELKKMCQFYNRINYLNQSLLVDKVAHMEEELIHVFAAGNYQSHCSYQSYKTWGIPGYGTTTTRSKNVLAVGAVDTEGLMSEFSSWGPQDDGRLFPTVCARGVDVYSTVPGNEYKSLEGTSMACPTVSGSLALLTQHYKQQHQNSNPRADMLRAIAANTADDAGRPHPDFQYGYGIMNADKALKAIEKAQYKLVNVAQGQTLTERIPVPKGATQARVMIAWNDPVPQKATAYGESILVNDVDLLIDLEGKAYKPWVCNPTKGHVEDIAARKDDHLNNMEQVTLNAQELGQAKELIAKINGFSVPQGVQKVILTWWFEVDNDIRVISPCGGELYAPGDKPAVVFGGFSNLPNTEWYTAEMSLDDGKSWKNISGFRLKSTHEVYPTPWIIPEDVEPTANARIRIRLDDGKTAVGGKFSICPIPQNLQIQNATGCPSHEINLSWDKVLNARHGYAVLLINGENGNITRLGNTADNHYKIPVAALSKTPKAFLSVAVRLDNEPKGLYGQHPKAIPSGLQIPIALSSSKPLFSTHFEENPSPYFKLETGSSNVKIQYQPNRLADAKPGQQLLGMVIKQTDPGFSPYDWFGSANEGNIGRIKICNIDLTQLQEDAYLHIVGLVLGSGTTENAKMHLLNAVNEEIPDQYSHRQIGSSVTLAGNRNGFVDYYFRLEHGTTHNLTLEFAAAEQSNMMLLESLEVLLPEQMPKLSFGLTDFTVAGSNLKPNEKYSTAVVNGSSRDVDDLDIRISAKGQTQHVHHIDKLKAFQSTVLTGELNLSSPNPLGEIIPVRFDILAPKLRLEPMASVGEEVLNYGTVFRHPEPRIVKGVAKNPEQVLEIDSPLIYTDNGGAVANYPLNQQSTLKIKPRDPKQRVRITFREFHLNPENAQLEVYTSQVDNLNLKGISPNLALSKTISIPTTIVSEAVDGAITLKFTSTANGESAVGWIADVDLVPTQNPLSLLAANGQAVGATPLGNAHVNYTVLNNWQKPIDWLAVRITNAKGRVVLQEIVPNITRGKHELTTKGTVPNLQIGSPNPFRVQVFCQDDYDGTDNSLSTDLWYDTHCIPAAPKGGASRAFLKELSYPPLGTTTCTNEPNRNYMYYPAPLKLYLQTLKPQKYKTALNLTTGFAKGTKASAHVFVDWNGDRQFDEPGITVALSPANPHAQEATAEIQLDLAAKQVGSYRMRVIIAEDGQSISPCAPEGLIGSIYDFNLELCQGRNPLDLELASVNAGQSGYDLPKQPFSLKVKNHSAPFDGSLNFTVDINGQKVYKSYDLKAHGTVLKANDSISFTLENFHPAYQTGENTITVTLDAEGETTPRNNTKVCKVYNLQKQKGIWSLNFTPSERAQVQFPKIPVGGKSQSFEMWVKLKQSQFSPILRDDRLLFAAAYGNAKFPDNSFVVMVGSGLLGQNKAVWTPANSLPPREWHHVAVVITDIVYPSILGMTDPPSCKVKIFIDGKEQSVTSEGENSPSEYFHPTLGISYNGEVKGLRIWRKALTAHDIKANWYSIIKDNSTNCVADFAMQEGAGSGILTSACSPHQGTLSATSLWVNNVDLFEKYDFTHVATVNRKPHIEPIDAAKKQFRVLFDGAVDLSQIKGNIASPWPNAPFAYSYDGSPIAASTVFNFTKPVVLTAEGTVFDNATSDRIELLGAHDKPSDCELLSVSFKQQNNPGLRADISSNVHSNTALIIDEAKGCPTNLNALVLSLEISPNAHIEYQGKEYAPSGLTVDGTRLIILKVVAANGNSKTYTITVECSQTVTLSIEGGEYIYGGSAPITASASSNRPLAFTSTNPEVAAIIDGKLHFNRPGKTALQAIQKGGYGWSPAASQALPIEVKKAKLSITPNPQKAFYGYDFEWAFQFQGLVSKNDLFSIPQNQIIEQYELKKGPKTIKQNEYPPIGICDISPKNGAKIEHPLYDIALNSGKLEIAQGNGYRVQFYVHNEQGKALDADIEVVGQYFKAKNGLFEEVFPKRAFVLTFSHKGYQNQQFHLDVANAQARHDITLQAATLLLTYTAGEHGAINGQKTVTQMVGKNGKGQTVVAQADEGWAFLKWSDGYQGATRTDEFLKDNLSVVATFGKPKVLLSYSSSNGGAIVGHNPQTITLGKNGAPITASPKPGYYFEKWSDGLTEASRTENQPKQDINVEATFRPLAQLPEWMDFSKGYFANGWSSAEAAATPLQKLWEVVQQAPEGLPIAEGVAALIAPTHDANTSLISPRYALDPNRSISIAFSYSYRSKTPATPKAELALEYRLDGKGWTLLQQLPQAPSKMQKQSLELPSTLLSGARDIQFRWRFYGQEQQFAMVDNIAIAYSDSNRAYTIAYVAIPSGSATFSVDGKIVQEQRVKGGEMPKTVEVNPKSGFAFTRWSTGETSPALAWTLPKGPDYTVYAFSDNRYMVGIRYKATPAEGGRFLSYGAEIHEDFTNKRGISNPVVATANPGWVFLHWADNGSQNPERILQDVAEPLTLEAVFIRAKAQVKILVQNESGTALQNVALTLGEKHACVSDAKGIARLEIPGGKYCLRADAGLGYHPAVQTVEIPAEGECLIPVTLVGEQAQSVVFLVKDGTTPLANARIRMQDGATTSTDSNGRAEVALSAKSHSFEVSRLGYKTVKGEVVLAKGQQLLHAVQLQKGQALLTLAQGTNGSINATQGETKLSSGDRLPIGTPIALRISPNKGYAIQKLTANGRDITGGLRGNSISLTLNEDTEIRAEFTTELCPLVYTSPNGGVISVEVNGASAQSGKRYAYGSQVKVHVEPYGKNRLLALIVAGQDVTTRMKNSEFQFPLEGETEIGAAIEILGRQPQQHQLLSQMNGPGSIRFLLRPSGARLLSGQKVLEGTEVDVDVHVPQGFLLKSILFNDAPQEVKPHGGTYSWIANSALSVLANTQEPRSLTVTFEPPQNGSLRVLNDKGEMLSSGSSLPELSALHVELAPATGYVLKDFTVNGESKTREVQKGKYRLTLRDNTKLLAVYTKAQRTPNSIAKGCFTQVVAHPNPCRERLYLSHAERVERVVLYDLSGRALRSTLHDGSATLELNMRGLGAGTYLLQLENAQGHRTLLIQRAQ